MSMMSLEELEALKREVSSISVTTDIQGKEIKAAVEILVNAIDKAVATYNSNDSAKTQKYNQLVDAVKTQSTEVQALAKTLSDLDEDNFNALIQKIDTLKGTVLDDVLELLPIVDKIADTVNGMDRVVHLGTKVVDTVNGEITVDINTLNLPDANYSVSLTPVDAPPTAQHIVAGKTSSSFTIKVYDLNYFPSDNKPWDATRADRGAVKYDVTLSRAIKDSELISMGMTPLDSDTSITIGQESGAGSESPEETPAGE
jgi:uncharacterized protein YukE